MTETEQWSPADIPAASESLPPPSPRRRLRAEEVMVGNLLPAAETVGASDEMCRRLQEASAKCQEYYSSWKQGNNGESQLSESLHELRRAVARVEIELAASHSGDSALRPIPIPLHRAHK